VERVLSVEFCPSRSKRFAKAVAEARGGAGECSELELGSYRVRFVLGSDGGIYSSLALLLQRVRNWRATEVYEGDQLVSSYHALCVSVRAISCHSPAEVKSDFVRSTLGTARGQGRGRLARVGA